MKLKTLLFLSLISFVLLCPVIGQESDDELFDDDLDSLFEEEPVEQTAEESETNQEEPEEEALTVLESLTSQTGFTFQVDYAFVAGYAPGWGETPWNRDESVPESSRTDYNYGYSQVVGVDLGSSFGLDFQLSENLRVKQSVKIALPDYSFDVSEFWAGYNFYDLAYMKMGLRNVKWGLGRNYSYTNLPSRIPADASGGDTYSFQIDKSFGVGGLQLLALTRSGYVDDENVENLTAGDMGYGFVYNIAVPLLDLNVGSFYHKDMYLRSFASVSTTLWGRTEAYAEGLWATHQEKFNDHTFSGSVGFFDQFWDERFSVNGEYYWNGEKDITYEDDDDELINVEESPYIYGHNLAVNLGFKPRGSKLSLFLRGMYNVDEETAKLIPGFRMKMMRDMSLYCAVPFALGDRDGTYYRSNFDDKNRPFAITFALRLDGDYKFARYE